MIFVLAACCIFTIAASSFLLLRLRVANQDGRSLLAVAKASDDVPHRLLQLLRASVDSGLLIEAGRGGLSDVAVRSRESRDPYQTAADLIDWLARESAATSLQELNGIIKGVYQLGHTLRAAEADVDRCLEPLLVRLKTCNVGGSPIERVERVAGGAILDPKTMAPLNYGARISQPLGVVIFDSSGRVLGKAKVLCR